MKHRDAIIAVVAAGATVCAAAWAMRRARAAAGGAYVPLGFHWDGQRGAYAKLNNDGSVSVYGDKAARDLAAGKAPL